MSYEMTPGVGVATGGITIVNAIGSGDIGGAAGLSLRVKARVWEERGLKGWSRWPGGSGEIPISTLRAAIEAYQALGGPDLDGAAFEVESEVPPASGLKSSAALLTSMVLALLSLKGIRTPAERIAVAAAKTSIAAGLSLTGALDDHAASVIDAPVITSNKEYRILRLLPASNCDLTVAIGFPGDGLPINRVDPEVYRGLRSLYRAAGSLALSGHWLEASTVSGVATAMALGRADEARELALRGCGAYGVTGKGPSVFCVSHSRRVAREALAALGYEPLEASWRWC